MRFHLITITKLEFDVMKKIGYFLAFFAAVMLAACSNHENRPATNDTSVVANKEEHSDESQKMDSTNTDDPNVMVRQNNEEENTDAGLFSRKEKKMYAAEQLYGEWVNGTLHEVYNIDGTGLQWDTKDDVGRDEAQQFTWQMENNNLRQIYSMQMGGVVPRAYTVTFVDDESLVYKDDFGTSYMWDKSN